MSMILKKYSALILTLTLLILGCKNVSPMEYAKWVENEDNGLRKVTTEGDYIFSLQYKPLEYIVAMQERSPKLSGETLRKAREEMEGMQYYNFKISTRSGHPAFSNSKLEFEEKSRYLMSDMQRDMYLLEGKDTLHCKMFHFENASGILPYDNCVIAFDKLDATAQKDKKFLFHADKLGLEWLEITIAANDIKRTPKLRTN